MDADTLLRRLRDLLLFANFLTASERAILGDLARRLAAGLPPGAWWTRAREQQIRAILARWRGDVAGAYRDVEALLADQLPPLAGAYRQAAGRDTGKPQPDTPVRKRPELEGATTDAWLEQQRRATEFQLAAALRKGANLGETNEQIAARVAAVIARREREVATLTRTATLRASVDGYEAGLRAAGVERYRYVAVMDERTTDICRGLNGQIFDFADPTAPRPPQHWNCRSHIEPVVDVGAQLVPVGRDLTAAEWAAIFRAEMDRRTAELATPDQLALLGRSTRQITLTQLRNNL